MAKRIDRLLVLGAAVVIVAIAWPLLVTHGSGARRGQTPDVVPAPAPVPELVRLVPSSTAFLANCPSRDLHLSLGPGRTIALHFAGERCHVPPLHLQAVVRNGDGAVVYRGPALAHEELSGNYAVAGVAHAPLEAPCGRVIVSGSGLSASAAIRCP